MLFRSTKFLLIKQGLLALLKKLNQKFGSGTNNILCDPIFLASSKKEKKQNLNKVTQNKI